MKKAVFVLVLVGLGIAVGIVGYRRVLADQRAASLGELRLYGNVDIRDARLAFFDAERIDRVLVEEGARVEAGDLLATQHTERLMAQIAGSEAGIAAQQAIVDRLVRGTRPAEIEQARAGKDAADARVANTESVIARLETTALSGATSAQALDDARAQLAVERATARVQAEALALALEGPRAEDVAQARATLAALSAELQLLERRLADSELRAPAPGMIQSRILEPGEMASAERPVFTLALTDPKWVRAWVPEPDLARVANGMRATVHADAFGGTAYAGWVGFISPVAEFTPKSVQTEELRTKLVFEVRVFVQDPNDELRLGMPVTVDIDSLGGTDHAPSSTPGPSSQSDR